MRLIAYLVLTVCVAAGALSAATAYLAPLSLDDQVLVGRTLAQNAGKGADGDALVAEGSVLDEASLATLRDAGVKYVQITEFSFGTWGTLFKAGFALSVVGLAAGGMMIRVDAKRRLAGTVDREGTFTQTPEFIIQSLTESLFQLRKDLPGLPDEPARLHAIMGRLEHAQRSHVADFIDARQRLIGRHGLGGYAMIMDRFAAAERQINRAWSAAADGVYDEAETCLKAAADRLRETSQTLKR